MGHALPMVNGVRKYPAERMRGGSRGEQALKETVSSAVNRADACNSPLYRALMHCYLRGYCGYCHTEWAEILR